MDEDATGPRHRELRRNRDHPTAADVVGVPLLPPGWVTAAGNRARGVLGRLHQAMAPPPVRILSGLFGMLEHRALVVLCRAGVPDALTGPMTVLQLASQVAALTRGGRERGTDGFADLGHTAGLRHERAVRLASGDLAHVFHPAGR